MQQKHKIWSSTFVLCTNATWNFYKNGQKLLCTGAHKRILIHYALPTEILVSGFYYIQAFLNVIKSTHIFAMVEHTWAMAYLMYSIHDLSTGQIKTFGEWLWLDFVKA